MAKVINNPTVHINNNSFAILANTFEFDEGLGEQDFKVTSTGGGNVTPVFVDNIETRISTFNLEALPTIDNIELLRQFKILGNNNLVRVSGIDDSTGKEITRTFLGAALTSNYKINLKSDGTIPTEWKSRAAV